MSHDIRSLLYFRCEEEGVVELVIDPALRAGTDPIYLSAAAAEDLSVNLEINAEAARKFDVVPGKERT